MIAMNCMLDHDHITGVMVQYYKSCQRELWFYAHNINMNQEDENILIGRHIQESSYPRESKEIQMGPVSFDFVKKGKKIVVHEVKKSRKMANLAMYQLYYYLWFLRGMGIEAEGCISYPKERKRIFVKLTKEKEEQIQSILSDIKSIISRPTPPSAKNKRHCKGCSYYEFCKV